MSQTQLLCVLFAVGVIACQGVTRGRVTLGNENVVSEQALIDSGSGSTKIGNGNVINPNVKIINRSDGQMQVIGNANVFGEGSTSESMQMGNGNVLKAGAFVGYGVVLGNACVIEPGCRVEGNRALSDGTVISC